MRSRLVAALAGLLCLCSVPASAQWSPAGPLSFVQGSTNNVVELLLPMPYAGFEAADITITYDPLVFEPLELIPGVFVPAFGSTTAAQLSPGVVLVSLLPAVPPVDLESGTLLFGARFNVFGTAPLGLTNAIASVVINEGTPFNVPTQINITPVPEPGTWALMAAGLGLVIAAGMRRRVGRAT